MTFLPLGITTTNAVPKIAGLIVIAKTVSSWAGALSSGALPRYVFVQGIADTLLNKNGAPLTPLRESLRQAEFAARCAKDPIGCLMMALGPGGAALIPAAKDVLEGVFRDSLSASPPAAAPALHALVDYMQVSMIEDLAKLVRDIDAGRRIGFPINAHQNIARTADPIILHRGEFERTAADLEVDGAGINFSFQRTYRSSTLFVGPLGHGWDHSYNLRLFEEGAETLVLLNGRLSQQAFFRNPGFGQIEFSYYAPPDGIHAAFVPCGSSYTQQLPGGRVIYFEATDQPGEHRARRMENRFGHYLGFEYVDGRLARVNVNSQSRYVSFAYDPEHRLRSISDHTGRRVFYGYDTEGHLSSVRGPVHADDSTTKAEYFEYDEVIAARRLTRVFDSRGRTLVENEYERSTFSEFVGYVTRQRQGRGESTFFYENIRGLDTSIALIDQPALRVVESRRNGHVVEHTLNGFGHELRRCERYVNECRSQLATIHTRYNDDGEIVGNISPEGTLTQTLFTRDFLARTLHWPAAGYALGPIPLQTRMSFGNLLAHVVRGKPVNMLNVEMGNVWQQMPAVEATDSPSDVIWKHTYHPVCQLRQSTSDPRYTSSPSPTHVESAVAGDANFSPTDQRYIEHQRHLTRLVFGGAPARVLNEIVRPSRSHIAPLAASPSEVTVRERFEYDAKLREIERVDANGFSWFTDYHPLDGSENEGFVQRRLVPHIDWHLTHSMPNVPEFRITGSWTSTDAGHESSGYRNDAMRLELEGVRVSLFQSTERGVRRATNSQVEVKLNGALHGIWDQSAHASYVLKDLGREAHVVELLDPVGQSFSVGRVESHVAIEYEVDGLGRVVEETDARGSKKTRSYNALGLIVSESQEQSVREFEYSADGNPTVTRSQWLSCDERPYLWVVKRSTYAEGGRLLTQSDGPEADEERRTTHYRRDAADNLWMVRNARGVTVLYSFDAMNHKIRDVRATCSPEQAVVHYGYDREGNLLFTRNPRGAVHWNGHVRGDGTFQRGIDVLGRVRVRTDPMGNMTVTDFDKLNNVTAQRLFERAGGMGYRLVSHVRKTYDENGALLRTSDAVFDVPIPTADPVAAPDVEFQASPYTESSIDHRYDAAGNLIVETKTNGSTKRFAFDGQGRPYDTTDSEGRRVFKIYDGNGNATRTYFFELIRDPTGNQVGQEAFLDRAEYDRLDRETARIDGYDNRWEDKFDSLGNLSQITDPAGRTIRYAHNAFGERTTETRELRDPVTGGTVSIQSHYRYDKNGNLTTAIDASEGRTDFRYDALDRQIDTWMVGELDLRHETRAYDRAGNLVRVSSRNGVTRTFTFDLLDRLIRTTVDLPAGSLVDSLSSRAPSFESFTYDAANRVTEHRNPYCTVRIQRDSRGLPFCELVRIRMSGAPREQEIRRHFDLSGRRDKIWYPSGRQLRYQHDSLGRVTKIETNLGELIAAYSYTGSRLSRVEYGNGLALALRHDGRGVVYERVVSRLDGTFVWRAQKLRDGAGYARQENMHGRLGHVLRSYAYDSAGRLTTYDLSASGWFEEHAAVAPAASGSVPSSASQAAIDGYTSSSTLPEDSVFELDSRGNRLQTREPGSPTVVTHPNHLNQYEAVDGRPWIYDEEGNLVRDDDRSYRYDAENRLLEISSIIPGAREVDYYRDALGRVIAEVTPGGTTFRLYDEGVSLVELGPTGDKEITVGRAPNEVVHLESGGDAFWITQDGLGSLRLVTDTAGGVVAMPTYKPFGQPYDDEELVQSPINIGFAGMWRTPNIPVLHSHTRTYRADIGRFLQRDPAGFVDGLNLYTYAGNNPIGYRDSSGLQQTLDVDLRLNVDEAIMAEAASFSAQVGIASVSAASDMFLTGTGRLLPKASSVALWAGSWGYIRAEASGMKTMETTLKSLWTRSVPRMVRAGTPLRYMLKWGIPSAELGFRVGLVGSPVEMFALKPPSLFETLKFFAGNSGSYLEGSALTIERTALAVGRTLSLTLRGASAYATLRQVQQSAEMKQTTGTIGYSLAFVIESTGAMVWASGLVLKSEAIAGAGAFMGTAGLAVGVLTGSVVLAEETVRAAVTGQPTPLEVADEFYGTKFSDLPNWDLGWGMD